MKKTVLITGTSSGIGKASAILFQKKGWNVAATMKSRQGANNLTTLENVRCYTLDVTDRISIQKGIKSVIKDFGSIDVLINNAGIYSTGPLESASDSIVRQIFDVNVQGTINVTREMLPLFRNRKKGTIINVSSIAGKVTFPFQSLYHSTKWAIEGFSRGLSHELRPFNITVKTVAPGMVKTNFYDAVQTIEGNRYPEDYWPNFKKWHQYLMKNFIKGYGPEVSAKTIYKAATDHRLTQAYASGMDTKMVFTLKKLMPHCIFNTIIRKSIGI
jgi:NADP-dependent 3-hydroxy acid dehydrogenase YdfG